MTPISEGDKKGEPTDFNSLRAREGDKNPTESSKRFPFSTLLSDNKPRIRDAGTLTVCVLQLEYSHSYES